MRSLLLSLICVAIVGLCAVLSASPDADAVTVRIRLLDAESGQGLAGLVRAIPKDDKSPLALPGLFDRLKGLQRSATVAGWYIVPSEGAVTTLPRAALRLEALSGLETGLTRQTLDLRGQAPTEVTLKLPFLFRPEQHGLAAGNTHLHLRKMTKAEADDYLRKVPAADGLKLLFLSYLERHQDDRDYITNQYPVGDPQVSGSTVLLQNGEEYRHNFGSGGQGFGHVMLLNIRNLIKPASVGPGISGGGFDDRALESGIADARQQGGTILWCHNAFGYEGLPRALSGQLDALNVFDGGNIGGYEERYYRLLNIGLRLPISTGTDWFMYDFSRVYAKVPPAYTIPAWLAAVKAGRCVATNGPLLSLTVDGQESGAMLDLPRPRAVQVRANAVGRHDFGQLQLVRNGQVIKTQPAESKDGAFRAQLSQEVRIDEPSWFAVRIDTRNRNELGQPLFAHSAPVYVDLGGQRVFDVETARALMKQLSEAQTDIRAKGHFSSDEARDRLLAGYEQAAKELAAQLNRRGR